jgi:hypothetical protein
MLADLAGDPELRLDMNLMPGDIQFLRNHTILHARSAYEDWPGSSESGKIAGVLRENLTCENGNRLAMARGFTSRSGIEDLAAGKQPGEKRLASCGALSHPAVRCPDGLFEIIDSPGRPVPGAKPQGDLELAPWPL